MKKAKSYTSSLIQNVLKDISSDESIKIEKRMLLAARIDDGIKAKGWKQKDLARAINKSPSEISKWMSGVHNFTADTLFDLERVLEIHLVNVENNQLIKTFKYKTIHIVQSHTQGGKIDMLSTQTAFFLAKAQIINCYSKHHA